jgi:beta-galactosidase
MLLSVLPYTLSSADLRAEAREPVEFGARKIKMNDDWRFRHLATNNTNNTTLDATASQIGYTETGTWSTVQLPHDWSIYQGFDYSTARAAQGALIGGTGWYRKAFTLSDDLKDKNVVLQFDAVQMVSDVWVNGTHLGKQFLGYVTFEYDITEYLRFDGQENVIAVKAFSANNSARWYPGAGIYGSVYLIATDKIHIPVNGIHVAAVVEENGKYVTPDFHRPPDMDALRAKSTVNVRTNVENKTAAAAEVSIRSVIYSKENANVASKQEDGVVVPAGGKVKIDQLIDIANPKLWSIQEPNLYWVKTEIIQNGRVADTLDTRFGIRYLYLSPGSYTAPYSEDNTLGGLYLNGEYTPIHGVCEHRDLGALGMETYQAAVDRRLRKLKSMGVNVVRTAHNPISPEYIEAADRLGMLIFEEGFDQWMASKNGGDYSNYFNKAADGTTVVFQRSAATGANTYVQWLRPDLVPNAVRDIQAMVNRDKNSPSVFLWSTGNEIYDTKEGHGLDTQWLLAAAIKEIDSLDNIPYTSVINTDTNRTIRPTPSQNHAALPSASNNYTTDHAVRGGRYARPVSSAPPTWDSGASAMIDNMAMADIGGHNYSRATNQYATHKNRYPNMSVAGTETVSAFYTRGVYNIDHYKGGEAGFREAHSSGYASEWPFNRNFVTASISIREHREDMMPFLFGEMVWTGHDYLGEPTPHGNPSRSSYFGIIDTAGFEKDAFYMYRSAWTDIPTVHLLPQKWNWDMGTQVPIMVYTNAASVEVFINDRSLGVKSYDKKTASPVYLEFGFQLFQPGELKAVAKDAAGNVIATDVVYTAGEAQSIVLSGDRAFIRNDGTDLLFVEATVVDSAGVMVPTANNRITFAVQGGEIVALDNGDPRDNDPFRGTNNDYNRNTSNNRRAFNGKALAIVRATEGSVDDIVVTATAPATEGQIASNTVTVGARAAIGDGTGIYAYEKPEVTTGAGLPPVLPETVGVIYDNGLIEQVDISSWDLAGVDLNAVGTYTARGVSVGTSGQIEAIVHVKAIDSIDRVAVTTIAGVQPPLPRSVTLRFADGTVGAAQVTWDPVSPAQYADQGTFTVTGKLGPALNVVADVTVKRLQSIDDITLHTVVNEMPVMPATVMAKFTDGTQEMLGVDWDITPDDVEFVGVKKVTGVVLASDIKATAWVRVNIAVYASDLPWTSQTGTVNKDKMIDGRLLQARGLQGGPGEAYEKGIGTLAPAEVAIDIAGKGYERFQSYINLSIYGGGVAAPGAVAFKVYLDDETEPVFASPVMDSAHEAAFLDIDVTGRSAVRLVTEARGTDGPEHDLADWVDTKFLSTRIAVSEVDLPKQIYLNSNGRIPTLPSTVQATVPGAGAVNFKVMWQPLTAGMFPAGSVQPVYGPLEGTSNGVALARVITDYNAARRQDNFHDKVGSWSESEKFDYPIGLGSANMLNLSTAAPTSKLIYSASANMRVENVQSYGFEYGAYPNASGNNNQVVFAAPGLRYFRILNVASTTAISNSGNFTFATSTDGTNWTNFTAFTKSGVLSGTGTGSVWPQRTFTSNDEAAFPEGTNFLRVTYPSGNTWQFNMTGITLRGGRETTLYDTALAYFKLGEYDGIIDHNAGTVTVTVPKAVNVTNLTPEVVPSAGAAVRPAGPQDFTNPVTYIVSNGGAEKAYVVTVGRGVNVSFNMYGGSIGDSAEDIVVFVPEGTSAPAPAASPTRDGYVFRGWTTDRASKTPVEVGDVVITDDTTFYAVWEKNPYIEIRASADATLKTWQSEKNSNYGSDSEMLLRQTNNTGTNGQFGENFTSTSTSDGTDIKTSLIRFNIESLKGMDIKSATLALWYAGSQNGTASGNILLRAARANPTWNENQVTWVNYARGFYASEGTAESGTFSTGSGRAVTIDVTDIYRRVPDVDNQLAIALSANSTSADYRITSKEGAGANPSRAPTLRVEIAAEPDYMVTYDLNGGGGEVPIQPTVGAGDAFGAAHVGGITPPGEEASFVEWNTEPDGSGTGYQPGEEITMPAEDLTLYAIWTLWIDVARDENTVTRLTVHAPNPIDAFVILAAYDDEGRLLNAEQYRAEGAGLISLETDFDFSAAAQTKIFLWSADLTPLIDPKQQLTVNR